MNDWTSSSKVNVIGVIISALGLITSSFSDISILAKLVVIFAGFLACLYIIFGVKARSITSKSTAQTSTDVPPASPPAPSAQWVSDQASPTMSYPQTPPNQPMPQPAIRKGTSSSPYSLKERLLMLLASTIMFGFPGLVLFRSSVTWQHIVGIILLVFLVLSVLNIVFPNLADELDKFTNKTADLAEKLTKPTRSDS